MAPAPNKLNIVEAAALPLVGVSAVQALEQHIKLQRGQKILIHGGGGGIGSLALQIAKSIGAYVATTATGARRTGTHRLAPIARSRGCGFFARSNARAAMPW